MSRAASKQILIDRDVTSVNGEVGEVLLKTDNISDVGEVNKYTSQTDIDRLVNTSGTNTGDQDISGIGTNATAITTLQGNRLLEVQAGTNVTVDNADPLRPIVSAVGGGGTATLEQEVIQVAHGFIVGDAIKLNIGVWVKAQANNVASTGTLGVVKEIIDVDTFVYQYGGILTEGTWNSGVLYFLSPDTPGLLVEEPVYSVGQIREYVGTGTPDGLLIEIDLGDEISESNNAIQSVTGNLIDNTDPLNPVANASSAISADPNNAAVLGSDDKVFVAESSMEENKLKEHIQVTGMFNLQTSNTWVTFSQAFGWVNQTPNQARGADALPSFSPLDFGVTIPKGYKVNKTIIYLRDSGTEDVEFYLVKKDYNQGDNDYENGGGATYDFFELSNGLISGLNNIRKKTFLTNTVGEVNAFPDRDGQIIPYLKPIGFTDTTVVYTFIFEIEKI